MSRRNTPGREKYDKTVIPERKANWQGTHPVRDSMRRTVIWRAPSDFAENRTTRGVMGDRHWNPKRWEAHGTDRPGDTRSPVRRARRGAGALRPPVVRRAGGHRPGRVRRAGPAGVGARPGRRLALLRRAQRRDRRIAAVATTSTARAACRRSGRPGRASPGSPPPTTGSTPSTPLCSWPTWTSRPREAIVARLWGGLTFEEVARLQGCSLTTAHRRYQAGLARLHARLESRWTSITTDAKTT